MKLLGIVFVSVVVFGLLVFTLIALIRPKTHIVPRNVVVAQLSDQCENACVELFDRDSVTACSQSTCLKTLYPNCCELEKPELCNTTRVEEMIKECDFVADMQYCNQLCTLHAELGGNTPSIPQCNTEEYKCQADLKECNEQVIALDKELIVARNNVFECDGRYTQSRSREACQAEVPVTDMCEVTNQSYDGNFTAQTFYITGSISSISHNFLKIKDNGEMTVKTFDIITNSTDMPYWHFVRDANGEYNVYDESPNPRAWTAYRTDGGSDRVELRPLNLNDPGQKWQLKNVNSDGTVTNGLPKMSTLIYSPYIGRYIYISGGGLSFRTEYSLFYRFQFVYRDPWTWNCSAPTVSYVTNVSRRRALLSTCQEELAACLARRDDLQVEINQERQKLDTCEANIVAPIEPSECHFHPIDSMCKASGSSPKTKQFRAAFFTAWTPFAMPDFATIKQSGNSAYSYVYSIENMDKNQCHFYYFTREKEGIYRIHTQSNSQYLTSNSAGTTVYYRDDIGTSGTYSQWRITNVGGAYSITNVFNGKHISTKGGDLQFGDMPHKQFNWWHFIFDANTLECSGSVPTYV